MPNIPKSMIKKGELWIAVGGDELTGAISFYEGDIASHVKVIMSGIAQKHHTYVAEVILSAIENIEFEYAEIDIYAMPFFDGCNVNQYALECIIKILLAATRDGRTSYLQVSGNCVAEVLRDVFGKQAQLRHSVIIQAFPDTTTISDQSNSPEFFHHDGSSPITHLKNPQSAPEVSGGIASRIIDNFGKMSLML